MPKKKKPVKNIWRDKARAAEREREEIFRRFVAAVSTLGNGTANVIRDDFGGVLCFFYHPASPGDYVPLEVEYSTTARSRKPAAERSAILAEHLPSLQEKFSEDVPAILRQALADHARRCEGPLRVAIVGVGGWREVSYYDGTQEFAPGVRPKPTRKVKYEYGASGGVRRTELGMKGRPTGTKKAANVRQQERETVISKIQEEFQTLLSATGKEPTKTAVARQVGFGGLNPATGTDSSLNALNNKLKRLGLDYKAVVEAVRLNK